MIHMGLGKPRNGKSLGHMRRAFEALRDTQMFVVTNMVIRFDELQEYCDDHGMNVHVMDRVRILTDEETPWFFLYRQFGVVLKKPDDIRSGAVDYTPVFDDDRFYYGGKKTTADGGPSALRGTLYIIDEVHTHFPARNYQKTGVHVPFYLSQHGKLNDTVRLITQNLKFVDPELYRAAQDFTYFRNKRLEKYGIFRGDNKIVAKTYLSPLTNTDTQAACEVEEFKIDGLAKCYDTSAGVGMPGGGVADGGARRKGVPVKMVFVAGAAVLICCWLLFAKVLPAATNKFLVPALGGKTQAKETARLDAPSAVVTHLPEPTQPLYHVQRPQAGFTGSLKDDRPPVRVLGYVVRGEQANVVLSDGRTVTEKDGLRMVSRNSVNLDGEKLYLTAPRDRVSEVRERSPVKEPTPAVVQEPVAEVAPESASSWKTDAYGVQKLTQKEEMGKSSFSLR